MSEYENLLRQIKSQVPVDESFDLLERKLKIGERDATMFFVDGLVDGDYAAGSSQPAGTG